MKRYRAHFQGRTLGAIGIFYWIDTTVEAENVEAAERALYAVYEPHHGFGVLVEVPQP